MKLRELRLQNGMTQRQVAEYLGCAPSVYSRYETGEREPSIETLIRLSACLGASIDAIVGNEGGAYNGTLDLFETALVRAAREADDRAREDALNMLLAHKTAGKKESLA